MKNDDKNRAAYLLSDEIYGAFRGVSIAKRLLSNMYGFHVDEEDLAKLEGYEAILRLSELSWRMELLVTQLCGVAETLGKLDTAAKEYSPRDPSTTDKAIQTNTGLLAQIKELTTGLEPAAQKRVMEIFNVDQENVSAEIADQVPA